MTTNTITKNILETTTALEQLPSLIPGVLTDKYFSELVTLVTDTPDNLAEQVLGMSTVQSVIPKSQALAAEGETLLEKHWAEYFIKKDNLVWEDLQQFPYYKNYETLAEIEVVTIGKYSAEKRMLFVGGGALPLSALLYAQVYGYTVDIIDRDEEAVIYTEQLISKLGLSKLVSIRCADLLDYQPSHPVIFLAAMVGESFSQKQAVFKYLASFCPIDTLLISRGVVGLGQLLYVSTPVIEDVDNLILNKIVRGPQEIINTIEIRKIV